MSDGLFSRIASRDPVAIKECIDLYGGLVWAIARRFSRTPADAEDAVQEVFLDLWRSAHRFDGRAGGERAFIATIARRRLIDRLRKQRCELPSQPLSYVEAVESSTDVPERQLDAARAMQILSILPLHYRRVLQLSLLQGLSHAEIASQLQLPLGSVKSSIRRGLLQMSDLGRTRAPMAARATFAVENDDFDALPSMGAL